MKLGLLVDSFFIPLWAFNAIEQALTLDGVVPCVLIVDHVAIPKKLKKKSFIERLNARIFHHYVQWDAILIKNRYVEKTNDAFYTKDIRELIPNVDVIEIHEKKHWELIKKVSPDLIFKVGCSVLTDELISIPPVGVWTYYYWNSEHDFGEYCGFWESYYDEGTISASLQQLLSHNRKEILFEMTCPASFSKSPSMAKNDLAWNAAPLFALCLKKLILTGHPVYDLIKKNSTTKPHTKYPHALNILRFIMLFIWRYIIRLPRLFDRECWSIYISNIPLSSKTDLLQKNKFVRLNPPRGFVWADPFIIKIKEQYYIFFEEYDYKIKKGVIKTAKVNADNSLEKPMMVLETQHHLSFPFIFFDENILYLLPEQAESGELILYQCVKFPDQWEIASILLTQKYCYDPVLIKKDNQWWLFVSEQFSTHGADSVYGMLYFSDTLHGPWMPHPRNPISMDCHYSRSAGAVFQDNGCFIRPVQDCSQGYGFKVNFLKMVTLSNEDYEDHLIGSIEPTVFEKEGVHTINFCDHLTAIDCRQSRMKLLV